MLHLTTRRTFLHTTAMHSVAALTMVRRGSRRSAPAGRHNQPVMPGALPPVTDPAFKAFAQRALDAATAAGARYADVRFTITRRRTFSLSGHTDRETRAVGVRALAQGPWGFAAHSEWTPERVAQLGAQAALQAKAATWVGVPPIAFLDHPPAAVGHWAMPVQRDPWTVVPQETYDAFNQFKAGINARAKRIPGVRGGWFTLLLTFERQEQVFASSAGAYTTQTVYTTFGAVPHADLPVSMIALGLEVATPHAGSASLLLPGVTPTGAGYEALEAALLPAHMDEWLERARMVAAATPFPQLGQYDVVFDGAAMGAIVENTFGAALDYERAVGAEADAGGTSYLAPPAQVLGTPHAPAAVTILGDRTLPRGAATVGWDAEGIAPQPFPLVKDGVVVDYASSREYVAELAPWYQRRGVPVRSNGCAAAEDAGNEQVVTTPNLVLQPATHETSLETLVAGVDKGFLIRGGDIMMDDEQRSGRGRGAEVYAIEHGKVAGAVKGAVYLFRSKDLWKQLVALGGAATAVPRGFLGSKGAPAQVTAHSVQAVAAHFQQVQVSPADTV